MPEQPLERTDAADASPRRAYRSRKREQASLETRQRIRTVAEALFLRDGYARTTTKAIAREAGVAEMTLFLAFDNKAALLSEIIRLAVRGDDHETPIAARARWQEMLDAPPHQILLRFAELNGAIQARTARILAVAEVAAAADELLAARRDSAHAHVRADFQRVADALAKHRSLAANLTADRAADVIYALANPTIYLLLTDERGWATGQYTEWLAVTLIATLIGPTPASTGLRAAPRLAVGDG
jgi:AcrR family transcriptional regulator